MALETTATLAEPRAGAVSSEVTPGADASRGSVSPDPPAEHHDSEETMSGTEILESLSPAALKKFKQTGLLPPSVEKRAAPDPLLNENENTLRQLTTAERKTWRETGELPERLTAPKAEKKAEAEPAPKESKESTLTGEAAELEKVESPVAKLTVLSAVGDKKEELQTHAAEVERAFPDRLKKDVAKYDTAEQTRVNESWLKVAYPQIAQMLGPDVALNFMTAVNKGVRPFLHAPYTFWRELSTNEAFRREVLNAGFAQGGNWRRVIAVISRFDAKSAPEKAKPLKLPPGPADSIGGKGTAPADEEGTAVKNGEFRRYMAAANRSDHLRKVGMRG
jgi:hypothetical protein